MRNNKQIKLKTCFRIEGAFSKKHSEKKSVRQQLLSWFKKALLSLHLSHG